MLTLVKSYDSPQEARCGLTSVDENVPPRPRVPESQQHSYSPLSIQHATPSIPSSASVSVMAEDSLMESFRSVSLQDQVSFLGEAVSCVASQQFDIDLPKQFVEFALEGMRKLHAAGRSNVIYGLCRGLGTSQADDPNESLFPTSRMPMGMLEYMVNFFNSEAAHNVSRSS